jgi:NADPH-dependent 7-cyano-7-deazaguanine reductase QueF
MTFRKIKIKENSNVSYSSPELLFLGESGQPYRGTLYVSFRSQEETFDLRDFKKYLTSLRQRTFNAEDIAYEIFSTIAKNISVKKLGVIVDLSARGGIQQRVGFGTEFAPIKKANIFQLG